MANLTLTGQQTAYTQIAPKMAQLKTAMDLRLPFWTKLPFARKRAWILSPKDPIMGLAWDVYKYLYNNYFNGVDPNDVQG